MRKFTLLTFLVLTCKVLWGQDLHYSQFYNSPLNINPALTGIFNGDQRYNLSYRNQWKNVPVEWLTFSGSYDRKFYPRRDKKSFLSAGLLFNYDRQGLSKLNLTNINLTGSYTGIINTRNLITVGAMVGYASRGFNPSTLTWDSQWNGFEFDPGAFSGENFDADRLSFLETSIGLNYRWQKSKRTKLDIGLGAFHFIEPSVGFYSTDDIKLPMRLSLNAVGRFRVASKFDIQLQGLAQFQEDYREYLVGALGIIHVNQNRGKETELHLGLQYRTGAALAPTLAIQYKNFYTGISYDVNVTDFAEPADIRLGALEIHFRYIITKVPIFKRVKVCPIF